LAIVYVVARGIGAREFSFPALGATLAPSELWIEVVGCVAEDESFRLGFIFVEERQLLGPPRVEGVVVFGGRPRCVFTDPELVSLRCTNSIRSARRCAASALASLSSSCLIRWCSPVASGLASLSAPGASASSIALSALVSS
jgi:hypothetical protein